MLIFIIPLKEIISGTEEQISNDIITANEKLALLMEEKWLLANETEVEKKKRQEDFKGATGRFRYLYFLR